MPAPPQDRGRRKGRDAASSYGVRAHLAEKSGVLMRLPRRWGGCRPRRRGIARSRGTATASRFRSPSRGRFLPRLRAAPSGRPFLCGRRRALMTAVRSPTISLAPLADVPEVFATRTVLLRGTRDDRRVRTSSPRPTRDASAGRSREGRCMRGNWTPRSAGPRPLSHSAPAGSSTFDATGAPSRSKTL